jgi:D-serine deaminase-like pyridoxal phosphate-dependent protein
MADHASAAALVRASPAVHAVIGASVATIDTPALVVDLDAMDRNIAALAAFANAHGVKLRPHAKMHKCAAIAALQVAAGAVGVCVQKTSEAEALADAGVRDIYISNEVVDPAKLARVAALAKRVKLAIAVDSDVGVDRLAAALAYLSDADRASVDVFVEIEVGQGRCGIEPSKAGALARRATDAGLRVAGLQAYHGGAQHRRTVAEREAAMRDALARVRTAQGSFAEAGIACPLVTGAGTGTFPFEAASGVWGELQCGSYLFLDRDYGDNAPNTEGPRFEHALFVKSQVISRADDRAIVDAGHKTHAIDSGLPRVWRRDLEFANGGDEHGILRGTALPAIGETVWLVPGHCDPTVNLHDRLIGVRGGLESGIVESVWKVDSRGCVT